MGLLSRVKTWITGDTLTASDMNTEFDNILNNFDPDHIEDASANASAMQATADPYPGGTESLPTSLRGELQRIRYVIKQMTGQAQWYIDPAGGITPIGTVFPYAGSAAPTGYLICDGSAVSRTTYADLFAIISTTYGTGNGSTTFNIPDLRGRTPVGVGTGTWAKTFTASSSSGLLLTVPSNTTFRTGTAFVPSTTDTLPTGLSPGTTYYAIYVSDTTIKVATSLNNAHAGTAIAYTNAGTGTHTATVTLTARSLADVGGEESHALLTAEMPLHTHSVTDPGHTHSTHSHSANSKGNDSASQGGDENAANTGSHTTGITLGNAGSNSTHNIMQPFVAMNYIIKT